MSTNSNSPGSGISGGNASLFVSDLNTSVEFYTGTLGLNLLYQVGEHFAMIDAGDGFQIGLHPASESVGAPDTNGAIHIGLAVTRSIELVVKELLAAGVEFHRPDGQTTPVIDDDGAVKLAHFSDPDGNPLYLYEVMI